MLVQIEETIKACIHCGICLPACPTYQVTANEGHSPRGRLYLINDAIKGEQVDEAVIDYLDGCLECSACETVCPSGVDYINILEYARVELGLSHYARGLMASIRRLAFEFLLPNRSLMNMLRILARFLPLKLINKLSPNFDFEYKAIKTDHYYRCGEEGAKTISLPLGCVMDTAYNNVHWDTIKVLNTAGYDVYIPETKCCGALAYHSGEQQLGKHQLSSKVEVLSEKDYPVVMNSAGCGAWLKNHSDLEILDLIELLQPSLRGACDEAIQWIDSVDALDCFTGARNDSESIKAVYHPACHINHQQGVSDQYVELLEKIPGLELIPLYEADLCCGSAGFYNLIQSKMADKIGQRKAANIKQASYPEEQRDPDVLRTQDDSCDVRTSIVLTANPGCMSQIQAHLGDEYQVMHPVSFLNQKLQQL